MDDDGDLPAAARRRLHTGRAGYGPGGVGEILRRVAAGESLHRVCETPGMPAYVTACGWARQREGFRAGLEAARRTAGARFRGPAPHYCEATAVEIFDRLCQGEALIAICEDAHMPTTATVYRWMAHDAALREAVALAREIHGERMGELAFDAAMAVTPADWKAADVKLRHLRGWAGKLAPRRLGPQRAVAPEGAGGGEDGEAGDGGRAWKVIVKRFTDPLLPGEEDAIVLPGGGRARDVWTGGRDGDGD